MPRLTKKMQTAVKKSEAAKPRDNFELIPRGKYVARLSAVTDEDGDFGPRWVAEFTDITSLKGERYPGRQWYQMAMPQDPNEVPDDYEPPIRRGQKKLSKADAWAALQDYRHATLKAFFDGLGYTEDTDTDEMVDEDATALITIGTQTAKSGARKGERFNRVQGVEPVPEGFEFSEPDEDDDEEGF